MPTNARAVLAVGLGLVGLVALVGRSSGQDNVQRTSGQGAAPTGTKLAPAVIGCVDMNAVFKGYKKVEFLRKDMEAKAELKKAELSKLMTQGQAIAKEMESYKPDSPDFKDRDDKLTRLHSELEVEKQKAQREFAQMEAEALATIYKEIQDVVAAVAKHNGMNYVLQVSNEPVSGADPNSAVAAMSRSVIYSDPSRDITQVVLRYLNQQYPASAPAANRAPAQPAPAAAPRGDAVPPPSAGATPGAAGRNR